MSYLDDLPEKTGKAVKDAVSAYPDRWKHNVCAFALINKATGEVSGPTTGTVCHAQLSYGPGKENIFVVNAHKPKWAKENKDFLLWVAQEAPFSHGLLNRNEEEEILNHASVIDTGIIGVGGALWLCKAFRHFEEDTHKPGIWSKLRNEGLNGLQAFIGCDILTAQGSPQFYNSHVSLFCYQSPQKIRKFYDEFKKIEKITSQNANRGGYDFDARGNKNWGSLAGKKVKIPDGWGGYTEITKPCDVKEYVAILKEIFEGDPNNV